MDLHALNTTTTIGPALQIFTNPFSHLKRTTCDLCRVRKVRCDRVKPRCGRCKRTGQTCTYPSASGDVARINSELRSLQSRLHLAESKLRKQDIPVPAGPIPNPRVTNSAPHTPPITTESSLGDVVIPANLKSWYDCGESLVGKFVEPALIWSMSDRDHAMPLEWPVAADLQLSSVGVVDRYIESVYEFTEPGARPAVEVRDRWISLEMLSPNVAVEMWTSRGQLVIELIYNESYHREESIRLLLGLIHEQLSQGLGLSLRFDARSPGEENFMCPRKCQGM